MKIKLTAQAGTFESSDILILVQPGENGREIELDSTVLVQYEKSIKQEINSVLDKFEVSDIHLIAKDKGALNGTIAARVETAVLRGGGLQEGTIYETK
ncbi:MAG: citrate lyase acyl carrier protein [bacterium]|nr:citrate lyase acyl carrier protein [bacterium]